MNYLLFRNCFLPNSFALTTPVKASNPYLLPTPPENLAQRRLLQLSQRLVLTIDHLVGLPPPPPPVEFTRRVLLRRAYLRCALSEVTEGSPLRPSPRAQRPLVHPSRSSSSSNLSPDDRSSQQPAVEGLPGNDHGSGKEGGACLPASSAPLPAPWCQHRADVRLANFKMRMKKEKHQRSHLDSNGDSSHDQNPLPQTASPSSRGGEREAGRDDGRASMPKEEKLAPDHDAEMRMDADLLEILVPTPRPLQADLKQQPGLRLASSGAWHEGVGDDGSCDRTAASPRIGGPHKGKTGMAGFPKDDEERLSTAAAVGASATAASKEGERREHRRRTWCGLMEPATSSGDAKQLAAEGSQVQGAVDAEQTGGKSAEATGPNEDGVGGGGDERIGGGEPGDGDDNHARMTRIITISSFRFRRSLDWSFPSQQQHEWLASAAAGGAASAKFSSVSGEPGDEPRCGAGGDRKGHGDNIDNTCSATARSRGENRGADKSSSLEEKANRESEGRQGNGDGDGGRGGELSQPRLWSRMGIEVRAGHVALSLPPHFQLGELQLAAILQWKGIQETLGELRRNTYTYSLS